MDNLEDRSKHPTSVIRTFLSGSPSGAGRTSGSIRHFDPEEFKGVSHFDPDKNDIKNFLKMIRNDILLIRGKYFGLPDDWGGTFRRFEIWNIHFFFWFHTAVIHIFYRQLHMRTAEPHIFENHSNLASNSRASNRKFRATFEPRREILPDFACLPYIWA